VIDARGLSMSYGLVRALDDATFQSQKGEVVSLLGSNGAGKTTTLRAASGMIPLMDGEIVFDGSRIDGLAPEKIARRWLLHVPEGRGIFPTLTVGDTLRLAAAMAGAEGTARIDDALQTFPRLAERETQTVGTLSGGEQQMLALARGLIALPKLLMVDEMSQGLAPALVAELFQRIEAFAERGVSVLLVEQFVGQALGVAQRAYVLEKGEITFSGPSSKLAKDEDFVRGSYLGEIEGKTTSRPREDHFTEPVTVSLPPALLRSLEERADKEGVALGELIAQVVGDTRPATNGRKPAARRRRR